MYIALLKKCLLDDIYGSIILKAARLQEIGKEGTVASKDIVDTGKYFPSRAHTMVGFKRLTNVEEVIIDIKNKDISGDFMECGVWRGGVTILMNGMNKYFNLNRKVYVLDSFDGLPLPENKYPADKNSKLHEWSELNVSLNEVKKNFKSYDLLDDNVVFVKGYFKDTTPNIDVNSLALLRLDGDMYSSTIECLENLYDKVIKGGYIIIDDYNCPGLGCKKAVNDFREKRNINSLIVNIDWTGVYWVKE